eukprot:gnl/MRDRNA2_/MRDRNA2_34764_c0_seq1.p1 gnl/MRDRNA2_/MRDRNA2_34764_c0~~gnl/MRDRNA2_/MRDRNA2_34764_c0_seq1.p1  ORF type:complete len:436 (-),score=53.66 gnl/MRDRNA2_/MRDRNA2_34764_c0_seq1:491-1798(-)
MESPQHLEGWQARYTMMLLLFTCNVLLYVNRTNISVAVVFMYSDPKDQGQVLSGFFWGYLVSQVVAGRIAQIAGGKSVLMAGVALWSLATLLPLVCTSVPLIFAARVVVGIAEGVNYPAQAALCARWVPQHMISRAWGFLTAGEAIGTIIAFGGCPLLVKSFGWQAIFWVSSLLSVCWLVFFTVLASSSPEIKPAIGQISASELQYITATRGSNRQNDTTSLSFKQIATCVPFLATVFTHMCYNYSGYLALSWIPHYFKDKFHVDANALAVTAVVPYILMGIVAPSGGLIADSLMHHGFSRTVVRKGLNTLGMVAQAACFLGLCSLGSTDADLHWAVVYLTLGVGLGGFVAAGHWVAYLDLSSQHGMILLGIGNSFATIPGIVGQVVTGWILKNYPNNWPLIFSIVAIIDVCGALAFVLCGTGRQVFDDSNAKLP